MLQWLVGLVKSWVIFSIMVTAAYVIPTYAKEQGYTPQWLAGKLPPEITEWKLLQKMGIKAHAAQPASACENL